jgi:2-C-methyl-D-erythritol 4-phosphate cytidylyltransferase
MSAPRRFALIAAAGASTRFGGAESKLYALLAGVPVLRRSIDALNDAIALDAVFVILAADDALYAQRIGALPGVVPLQCGGRTRSETISNGLAAIGQHAQAEDWVLVHDAARPCVEVATLHRLLNELEDEPVGGLLALPLADTLKRVEPGAGLRVAATEDRTGLWCAQTPQMFRYAILRHALQQAAGKALTDEAQAIEALGVKPRLILGSPANIKVTHPEDLALAEAILGQRARNAG